MSMSVPHDYFIPFFIVYSTSGPPRSPNMYMLIIDFYVLENIKTHGPIQTATWHKACEVWGYIKPGQAQCFGSLNGLPPTAHALVITF
jgi:hypothetical protein